MDCPTRMTCWRCGSASHLITDDGPTLCGPCVLAWGQFGAAIASGPAVHEPSRFELAHIDHTVAEPGCLLCAFTGRSVQWLKRGRSWRLRRTGPSIRTRSRVSDERPGPCGPGPPDHRRSEL